MSDITLLGYIGWAIGIICGFWLFLIMVYLTVSTVGRAWYGAKREEEKR